MELYFGTKQVKAKPMTQEEYAQYIGVSTPSNIPDKTPPGYLVEYLNGGESNHPDHDGYISWSPKEVFDVTYQPMTQMTFGHAFEAMKLGHKVSRAGWNGKDMFIYLVRADSYPAQLGSPVGSKFPDGLVPYRAYIAMFTAQNDVVPWSIAVSDALESDWYVVK